MKRTIASICAGAVALAGLSTALPAVAASPNAAEFQQVRMMQHGPVFAPHGDYAYYNGQRGDRHYHRGWRQYNGYYFPPAAFIGLAIGGAILGGIFANSHH